MTEKLKMSSFENNLNRRKMSLVTTNYMSQTVVHKGLILQIWQDLFSNFDSLKEYVLELYLTWKVTKIYFHVFSISL
jgi:hypothetical protein